MFTGNDSKGSPKNQVPTKQKEKTLALFLLTLYNSVNSLNVARIHSAHALSLLLGTVLSFFDCTTSALL